MKKRLLSLLLTLCMLIGMMPLSAFATDENNVAQIVGGSSYTSLSEAVSKAGSGAKIILLADDPTEETIEIDDSVSIDLMGHSLPNGRFSITAGDVSISDSVGGGTIRTEKSDIEANDEAIEISGSANVTLNNIIVHSGTTDYWTQKAVRLISGTLTINGGSYYGHARNGSDAVFVASGILTINDGHFQCTSDNGCALSYNNNEVTGLTIRKGTFIANTSAAFWVSSAGIGGDITTEAKVKDFFLDTVKLGNYIVLPTNGIFNYRNITIASGLFVSDGFTDPENGSTDENDPAELIPTESDTVVLRPQILGGDNTGITYTWTKDDNPVTDGDNDNSTFTIAPYTTDDGGKYKVTVTQGDDKIILYWKIGVIAGESAVDLFCGETFINGYDTLAEAVADVTATNNKLVVNKPLDLTTTVDIDETVTLDLNGQTITQNAINCAIEVTDNGDLTLTDSETGGKIGDITNDGILKLSDAPDIASVSLGQGNYITLIDAYTGSDISVTAADTASDGSPVTIVKGGSNYTLDEDDLDRFTKADSSTVGELTLNTTANEIQLFVAHVHSWTYKLSDSDPATIVATCTDPNNTCDNPTDTIQIKAPTDTTYTGSDILATLDTSEWTLTTPNIAYYQQDSTGNDTPLPSTPSAVGDYKAKITVGADGNGEGGVTASVAYSITKAPVVFTIAADGIVTAKPAVDFTVTYTDSKGTETTSVPQGTGSYIVKATITGADAANYYVSTATGATGTIGTYKMNAKSYTATFGTKKITTLEGGYVTIPDGTDKNTNNVFYGWKYNNITYKPGELFTQPAKNVTFEAVYQTVHAITGGVEKSDGTALSNATVTLMSGSNQVGTTVSDDKGAYTFSGVPAGTYNIVVTYNGVTRTSMVTISDTSESTVTIPTIKMPEGATNSIVKVTEGTPDVVVGGLDSEADTVATEVNDATAVVEVKLTVTETTDTVAAETVTKIEEKASNVGTYLDITLDKTVKTTDTQGIVTTDKSTITETSELLHIIIPIPTEFQGKKSYSIVREHNDEVTELTEGTAGEHIEVVDTTIHLYAKFFSTYALAYTEYSTSTDDDRRDPTTTITYKATVEPNENGTATTSVTNVRAGQIVTITPDPDAGYQVDTLTVTDSSGRVVAVTDNGDGTYSYRQPSADVTITVTFAEAGTKTEMPFLDVNADDWFYDAVQWAVEHGVTSGMTDTIFNPYGITTRAQTVTFLYRAMGEPEAAAAFVVFGDVGADTYYYDAVAWAVENSITMGTSDTTFSPNMDCSRAHIITFLWRMMGEPMVEGSNPFTDVDADSYYYNAVLWAVRKGITSGTTATTFSPDKDCTRAEIVTFLYRALGE